MKPTEAPFAAIIIAGWLNEADTTDALARATKRYANASRRNDGSPERERAFERAADDRWEAEEAVLAVRSESPDMLKTKIKVLARRAATGLDVASELTAMAAN